MSSSVSVASSVAATSVVVSPPPSSVSSLLLPISLQKSLQEILHRTNNCGGNIRVLLFSTLDGVPLGRVYYQPQQQHHHEQQYDGSTNHIVAEGGGGVHQDAVTTSTTTAGIDHNNTPQNDGGGGRHPPSSTGSGGQPLLNEEVLSSIESVWAPPLKQIPLLRMGKMKQVTVMYDHGTLIHFYQSPVVVTVLCGLQCNLGAIRSTAIPLLQNAIQPLCTTLVDSLKPPPGTTTGSNTGTAAAAAGGTAISAAAATATATTAPTSMP